MPFASNCRLLPSLLLLLLLQLPFIAQYRKEQCGELLSMRASDEPHVVGKAQPGQSSHGGEQQPSHPDTQSYPPGTVKVCVMGCCVADEGRVEE